MRAVAVGLLAAATTTALFEADIGRSMLLSSSTVAGVPPVVFLLLAFALLRGAPLSRRLGWAIGACGVYAALGLASGVTLSLAHPMSLEGALRRSLWSFAPAPFVHLLAAPLVLLAWRSRVVATRVVIREERGSGNPPGTRGPASPRPGAGPDWDSVLHAEPPTRRASVQGTAAFQRAGRERGLVPGAVAPARLPTPAPTTATVASVAEVDAAPSTPPPPPMVAVSSPKPAAPGPVTASASAGSAPSTPAATSTTHLVPPPSPVVAPSARTVATPSPAPRPPRPMVDSPARPVAAPPSREVAPPARIAVPPSPVETTSARSNESSPSEPVVRIPFDRIADQLPPDVFTLPPARLAESLPEPNVLVIPRRLVLPQLGEGAVEIPWTLVDSQLPELAFAMPQAEVRRRFPGWVLSLPMDVVVRQIPPDAFRVQGLAADLSDIGEFPAPFNPGPPEPEEATPSGTTAVPPPAPPAVGVDAAPAIPDVLFVPVTPSPAPVAAPVPPPPPAPAAHPVAATPSAPPAPVAPAPRPTPPPPAPAAHPVAAAPSAPPTPIPAQPLPAPARTPSGDRRAAAVASVPAPAVTDDEGDALGRSLALILAPLGAFDWQARRIEGRPVVSFVSRDLGRDGIDALVTEAAPLVTRLSSWGVEQITIRTTRLACVVTPLGARGCLAATVRRGSPVAMLELMSARAGRTTGDPVTTVSPAVTIPMAAAPPAARSNGDRGVGEAERVLAVFGPHAASVAAGDGVAPGVFVFAGGDQAALASAARAVHEALGTRHDQAALGRLEFVVLRRGRERAVVRLLHGAAGAPAVLAAAGEVALAGRAHQAAAAAAAMLEAR
jgi:hypothetical protein